jgi:hypothetical protein
VGALEFEPPVHADKKSDAIRTDRKSTKCVPEILLARIAGISLPRVARDYTLGRHVWTAGIATFRYNRPASKLLVLGAEFTYSPSR